MSRKSIAIREADERTYFELKLEEVLWSIESLIEGGERVVEALRVFERERRRRLSRVAHRVVESHLLVAERRGECFLCGRALVTRRSRALCSQSACTQSDLQSFGNRIMQQ